MNQSPMTVYSVQHISGEDLQIYSKDPASEAWVINGRKRSKEDTI